jgi:hypothetical protein
MSDPQISLREQLTQAMDKIRRELEILQSPSSIGGGADNREVIAQLEAEYRDLKAARSGLGPHDA